MSDTKSESLSQLVPTRTEVEAAKLWIIIDRRGDKRRRSGCSESPRGFRRSRRPAD